MALTTLRSAALSAAALILYSTAQAQWPARWNNTTWNGDDQAYASCVDHRGNVFVVGKTYNGAPLSGGSDYDFIVVSYDATGHKRWEQRYDGPGHRVDIATACACDWEGNVYVAGVSYGGPGRGNDLTVIKYDSNGFTVWPSSGSYGSGIGSYDFDNGAVRMKDFDPDHPYSDGYDADGNPTVSLALQGGAGSQPTFAVTCPTQLSGHLFWRTVVFEPAIVIGGGSPRVQIKSGWPVEEFGTTSDDTPYAVAVYSDNSVYVAGGVHSQAADEQYTVLRYKAAGTGGVGGAHYWVDTWTGSGKPGRARAIALDYDGNAYTTWVISSNNGADQVIATERLKRDQDKPSSGFGGRATTGRTSSMRADPSA